MSETTASSTNTAVIQSVVTIPSNYGVCSSVPFCSQPYKSEALAPHGLDPFNITYVLVESNVQFYHTLCKYMTTQNSKLKSFQLLPSWKRHGIYDPLGFIRTAKKEDDLTRSSLVLGIGMHELYHEGLKEKYYVLHQYLSLDNSTGVPLKSISVIVKGSEGKDALQKFCDEVLNWEESTIDKTYKVFRQSRGIWQESMTKIARPVESVILPKKLKDELLKDVQEFVSDETSKWYARHGIPYKRGYLFYGAPGTGKSSLISVIAGTLGRNVCILSPSDPNMSDDLLASYLLQAPKNPLFVIEDIDSLFKKDQNSSQSRSVGAMNMYGLTPSPLTFSGLLNALDGISNPDGQLFIMTTNHPDRLDQALIRAGRVDVRVAFPLATPEQVEGMFLHFYPGEEELAKKFVEVIGTKCILSTGQKEGNTNMASLQQHFIKCRMKSAEDAVKTAEGFMIEETVSGTGQKGKFIDFYS